MTSQAPPELGNLVRLVPFSLDDLPAHPAFTDIPKTQDGTKAAGAHRVDGSNPSDDSHVQQKLGRLQSNRPALASFIEAVLSEATTFIDETTPRTFKEGSEKSSSPAVAKVCVLSRSVTSAELLQIPWANSRLPRKVDRDAISRTGEAWFARRSRHVNHSEEGTANFSEFDEGLRVEHCEHEREYTPDLFDSYKVLDWDKETAVMQEIGSYSDIRMRSKPTRCLELFRVLMMPFYMMLIGRGSTVYEMCHQLPFPLWPRVFPVLVITAKTGRFEFIVVQMAVDIHSLPEAFYSNGRNIQEGDSAVKRKKPVSG